MRLCLFIFAVVFSIPGLHAFPWDLAAIKSHIDDKFAEAKVEVFPFPHIIVEDVLPIDLYNELCAQWPDNTFRGIPNGWNTIRIGDFEGQRAENIYANEIWKQFSLTIVDQMIKKKVASFFHPYSPYRFGKEIPGEFLCNSTDLGEHRLAQNHQISAHVDQAYVFAPIMIYFPKYDEIVNIEHGTQFYRNTKNLESIDICFDHNVELVKTVPYKANTLCAFMQTPYSWHGAVHGLPNRKLYFTNIYLSTQFMKSYYGQTFRVCR